MTFNQLVDMSVSPKRVSPVDVDLELNVNGEIYNAYEAHVVHRELLFFCDKGHT